MRKSFFITCLAVFVLIAGVSCAAVKVTDPADPRFDVTQFKFEDYRGIERFRNAMRVLFPVGTPEKYIEKVLVQYGDAGAFNHLREARSEVRYRKEDTTGLYRCTFGVVATYDQDNKLSKDIWVNYECDAP